MAEPWTPFTAEHPTGADLPTDWVVYGPDIADERSLRLLGDPAGKRVLDVGCGAGHAAIALARQGAKVIAVEPSTDQLDEAREAAELAEVKVQVHHAQLHELAFLGADSIDAALSVYRLAGVADLDRVLRQVHRVLKPEAPLVLSVPHPAFGLLDPSGDDPVRITRAWFDRSPQMLAAKGRELVVHRRTIGDLFTSLVRANFRVDTLLEPEPVDPSGAEHSDHWSSAMEWVPATVILRARKEGI